MNFDKWDRIFMTNQQCIDLLDLIPSEDEARKQLANYDEYPLHRFVLTVPNGNYEDPEGKKTGSVFNHFYTMAGDHLDVRSVVETKGEIHEAFTFSVDMYHFSIKRKSGIAVEKLDQKLFGSLAYWEWIMLEFMLINSYILSDPGKTVEVKEIEVKKHSAGKTESQTAKKSVNKVRLVRRYTLKRGWKNAVKKRIHQITCQAWGVRGHYRHYKNGTVIFIQPYVKGKKRSEYQRKVYELFGNQG